MADTARQHRILHITRNLPPLVGGMERLNWHIADELSHHARVQVVGPRGAAVRKPADVAVQEVPLRPLWRFLLASALQALRLALRQRPDVVLAGSGLTAPAAWLAARACGARAAVYVHGLDVAVRHPVYRAFWHPILRRMDVVVANSRPTVDLVRALGVAEDGLRIVHPGVTFPESPQSSEALRSFREQHRLGEARLLLSIGRLTSRKGLREFVRQALPVIVQHAPDVLLVVIGDAPVDALQADVETREDIQSAADAAGVGRHLRFLGLVDDAALAGAYESAAAHIFPVRSLPTDPEGFGMVAIEAAAHGLPTVAFASGGVVDAVAEGQSGHLIPQGDYAAFAESVLRVLTEGNDAWRARAAAFAADFAWPIFGQHMADALAVGHSR